MPEPELVPCLGHELPRPLKAGGGSRCGADQAVTSLALLKPKESPVCWPGHIVRRLVSRAHLGHELPGALEAGGGGRRGPDEPVAALALAQSRQRVTAAQQRAPLLRCHGFALSARLRSP